MVYPKFIVGGLILTGALDATNVIHNLWSASGRMDQNFDVYPLTFKADRVCPRLGLSQYTPQLGVFTQLCSGNQAPAQYCIEDLRKYLVHILGNLRMSDPQHSDAYIYTEVTKFLQPRRGIDDLFSLHLTVKYYFDLHFHAFKSMESYEKAFFPGSTKAQFINRVALFLLYSCHK